MKLSVLDSSEYHEYYAPYLKVLGEADLLPALEKGREELLFVLQAVPENKLTYSYAKGKWTVAELIMHLMDAERVFQYRALRFARGDTTELPGFDQDSYVPQSGASGRTREQLMTEFEAIRGSTISLFRSFNEELLLRVGVASRAKMSVRALGFVISGHQAHHLKILQERYLS